MRREMHRHAVFLDRASHRIEPNPAVFDERIAAPGGAPRDRANARSEFVEIERFDDVVISPCIETGNAIGHSSRAVRMMTGVASCRAAQFAQDVRDHRVVAGRDRAAPDRTLRRGGLRRHWCHPASSRRHDHPDAEP